MAAEETPTLVVEHLDVKPGDRLVLRCPTDLTHEVIERIRSQFKQEFPDNRLIVLAGGFNLDVEHDDDQPPGHGSLPGDPQEPY